MNDLPDTLQRPVVRQGIESRRDDLNVTEAGVVLLEVHEPRLDRPPPDGKLDAGARLFL